MRRFQDAFRLHLAPPQGELKSHISKFLAFRQREKDDVKTYYSPFLHWLEEVRILDRLRARTGRVSEMPSDAIIKSKFVQGLDPL